PTAPIADQCQGGRSSSPSAPTSGLGSSGRWRFLSGAGALMSPSVGLAPELAGLVLLAQEAALLLDEAPVGAGHARVLGEGIEDLEGCLGVVGGAVGALELDAETGGHVAEGAALLLLVELAGEGEGVDPVDLAAHGRRRRGGPHLGPVQLGQDEV